MALDTYFKASPRNAVLPREDRARNGIGCRARQTAVTGWTLTATPLLPPCAPTAAGRVARERGAGRLPGRRWPPWKRASRRSPPATAPELVWLLEHPPLYTAGTSAKAGDLLAPTAFRSSEAAAAASTPITGPGQRVAYVMLDLNRRRPDIRLLRRARSRNGSSRTLPRFNVKGERREERVGVWVAAPGKGGSAARTRSPRSASACGAG